MCRRGMQERTTERDIEMELVVLNTEMDIKKWLKNEIAQYDLPHHEERSVYNRLVRHTVRE